MCCKCAVTCWDGQYFFWQVMQPPRWVLELHSAFWKVPLFHQTDLNSFGCRTYWMLPRHLLDFIDKKWAFKKKYKETPILIVQKNPNITTSYTRSGRPNQSYFPALKAGNSRISSVQKYLGNSVFMAIFSLFFFPLSQKVLFCGYLDVCICFQNE